MLVNVFLMSLMLCSDCETETKTQDLFVRGKRPIGKSNALFSCFLKRKITIFLSQSKFNRPLWLQRG